MEDIGNMIEMLYASLEGPKGTVEVYEIVESEDSARADDVRYEVRFAKETLSFWQEGEAMVTANEMAGLG